MYALAQTVEDINRACDVGGWIIYREDAKAIGIGV